MGWTNIASGSYDAESSVDETFVTALRDNAEYNYDHAVIGGTLATGARLTLARSDPTLNTFSMTADGGGAFSTSYVVTYSSGSDDGTPGFSSEPSVVVTLEEDETGTPAGEDWATPLRIYHYFTATSATGFTLQITGNGAPSSSTVRGVVGWMALGPVTSGE